MYAYDKAVSLLKIRTHYSAELAKKLLLRGFKREEVSEVINRLTEQRLLNDAQFVQNFLGNLIRLKTFGFYGLKVKLMQRGIPGNEAEVVLKENLPLEIEKEIAQRFLDKQKETDKIKLAQKMARKGYRNEVIREILNSI